MNKIFNTLRPAQGHCLVAAILLACLITGCDTASSTKSPSGVETAEKENGPVEKDKKIGVLLVSHGSRSKNWCNMVADIVNVVRDEVLKDGTIAGIRSAFMEYTEPSIATQLKQFDSEEYTDVIIVPLLMTVSSHSFDDIPTIIGQKEDRLTTENLRLEGIEIYKPAARVHMTPLLDFPEVLQKNVARRVRSMSQDPDNEGIVLVAYGAKPYEKEWIQLIDKVAQNVRQETGVTCIERAWCGHIVHYKSEPTEKAIRQVLDQKKRALVIPILVAVDETFQGKIIGGAIKNVNEDERIAYRHDAILPDKNINQWIVDISRQTAAKLMDETASSPVSH